MAQDIKCQDPIWGLVITTKLVEAGSGCWVEEKDEDMSAISNQEDPNHSKKHMPKFSFRKIESSSGRPCYNEKGEFSRVVFPCSVEDCGKIFKSVVKLNSHMMNMHKKEKKVKCPELSCGKMFGQKSQIPDHLRSTHNYPKLVCDLNGCKFSCASRTQLWIHTKRVHMKQKPQKCQETGCEKSYNVTEDLEDHLRRQHGYQKLQCGILGCVATFLKTNEFRKHRKEVHHIL